MTPKPRGPVREDTWGRLLAPARPAPTPAPALRRSHFPDPPPGTLCQHASPFLRLLPAPSGTGEAGITTLWTQRGARSGRRARRGYARGRTQITRSGAVWLATLASSFAVPSGG